MDYSLFKDINGLAGDSTLDSIMKWCANDLVFVLVAIVALLFLLPWTRRRIDRRIGAVTATASAGIALAIAAVVAHAVDRARPFVSHPAHDHLLIKHAADGGFPSDHSTAAFALAAAVFAYDRAIGAFMVVVAALVAFSRVFVGVHYPGDVVGGALIGIAVALVLSFGPLARLMQAIGRWCSELWDRIVGTVSGGRVASTRY